MCGASAAIVVLCRLGVMSVSSVAVVSSLAAAMYIYIHTCVCCPFCCFSARIHV